MSVRRFDLSSGGVTFKFRPETEDKVAFWLSKYPADRKRSAVIPMLWLAQKDNKGWLSEPAMRHVADRLEMPYIRVYEVATFYTMFRMQPVGEFHLQLCGTTPCMLRGSEDLKDVCTTRIGQKGDVSADGKFSWEEVECLGACVNAPMIQINDYYYEDLDKDSLNKLLDEFETGANPEPGPRVDRITSAPEGGLTTLTDEALYDGSRASRLSVIPNAPEIQTPVEVEKPVAEASSSTKDLDEDVKQTKDVPPADVPTPTHNLYAAKPTLEDPARPDRLEAPLGDQKDDLKLVSGIGPKIESTLNELGIFHFSQIAAWTGDNVAWVDGYLSFKGRIQRENWISQAKELAEAGSGAV